MESKFDDPASFFLVAIIEVKRKIQRLSNRLVARSQRTELYQMERKNIRDV